MKLLNWIRTRSWKTTLFGLICWVVCGQLVWENFRREAWSLHYWGIPFLAFACGFGLIFCRDHSLKDKSKDDSAKG